MLFLRNSGGTTMWNYITYQCAYRIPEEPAIPVYCMQFAVCPEYAYPHVAYANFREISL